MKSKLKITATILVALIVFAACDLGSSDKSDGTIGGSQSEFGKVGTTFTLTNLPNELQGSTAKVTELENGVSTIQLTANISEANKQKILAVFPNYDGRTTIAGKFRATSEGMQSVYDDGSTFTLVKYDAKVGDRYTAERHGKTIVREVISKSTEDEYYWGGMLIKTITVQETGRNIPGVNSVVMDFNHKFGFVGYDVNLEDGSRLMTNVDNSSY